MPEAFEFQMLFDESRSADQTWAIEGINPKIFPNEEVPFKYESEYRQIAAKFYAVAHRWKNVEWPPVYIVEVSIPVDVFLKSLFEGSIRVSASTNTMFFQSRHASWQLSKALYQREPNDQGVRWSLTDIWLWALGAGSTKVFRIFGCMNTMKCAWLTAVRCCVWVFVFFFVCCYSASSFHFIKFSVY